MLYAPPSALTHAGLDIRPNSKESGLPSLPTGLGFRGSVGLDVPCHAAVGSPYPLKTLYRPVHSGTRRNCRGGYTSSRPITDELKLHSYGTHPNILNSQPIIINLTNTPFRHVHTHMHSVPFTHTNALTYLPPQTGARPPKTIGPHLSYCCNCSSRDPNKIKPGGRSPRPSPHQSVRRQQREHQSCTTLNTQSVHSHTLTRTHTHTHRMECAGR